MGIAAAVACHATGGLPSTAAQARTLAPRPPNGVPSKKGGGGARLRSSRHSPGTRSIASP